MELPDTKELQPFHKQRRELSIEYGSLLRGSRVTLPPKLHAKVVNELHKGHPGITKRKALIRQYVWLSRLDGDWKRR